MGQAPSSQAGPRDTDHVRPSHLAVGTLRSVAHATLTLVVIHALLGEDSWRQSSAVSENHAIFAVRAGCGTEQVKPEPGGGFNTTTGNTCSAFWFPIP